MRTRHHLAAALGSVLLLMFAPVLRVQAQGTNPAAQSLPYTQDFSTLDHASTEYPAGWQGWFLGGGVQADYVAGEPAADAALRPTSDATSNAGGVHNYGGSLGLLGSGNVNTGNPALALSINTTGETGVEVSYDVETVRVQARTNAVALQYRVGTSGDFVTLPETEFTTHDAEGEVSVKKTVTVTLPAEADDQPVVQLRWALRDVTSSSARSSVGISNVSVSGAEGEPAMTIADARAAGAGATVTVEGVVSRARGAFTYFQDATAGLSIRQVTGGFKDGVAGGTITTGTRIRVTGKLSVFQGLVQINAEDLESFEILEQGVALTPKVVTVADLQGDSHQGQLVQINDLTVTETGKWASAKSYNATDGTGTVELRVPNAADNTLAGNDIPEGPFTYVGAVGHFGTNPQLMGILWTDIIAADAAPVVAFTTTSAAVDEGGTLTLDVMLANYAGTPVTVDVALTAGDAAEFDPPYTPQTLTFNASGTQQLTLDVHRDGVYTGDRTVTFTLQNAGGDASAEIGLPSAINVTIREMDSDAVPEGVLAYWNFNASTEGVEGGLGTLDSYDASRGGFPADLGEGLITTDFPINTIPGTFGQNNGDLGTFGGSTINALSNDEGAGALSTRGDHNNGKYVQFEFSTTGYQDVRLSFAGRGSSSGFGRETAPNVVSYSTDGGATFTDLTTYTSVQTAYELYTFDFGSALDDAANAVIRLTFNGATYKEGNNRIDNVQIKASELGTGPQPTPTITFAEAGGRVVEGETIALPIKVEGYGGSPVTVSVTLTNGTATWFDPAYTTRQVSVNADGTYEVSLKLATDGILTGDRLATFALSVSTGAADIGEQDRYLLRIKDADEAPEPDADDVIAYWNFNDSREGATGGLGVLDSYDADRGGFPSDLGEGLLTTNIAINTVAGKPEDNDGDVGSFGGSTINILNETPAGGAIALRGKENNGKYVQYEFSTVGFQNVKVSFTGRGTSTGFGPVEEPNVVSYSTDGGATFTDLESYTSRQGTWLLYSFDFGNKLDNLSKAIVRMTLNGATSDGGNNRMDNVRIVGGVYTSVEGEVAEDLALAIERVWPNPANGTNAQVSITLDRSGEIALDVYDVLGRRVSQVAGGNLVAGRHTLTIQTADLSAGVYFVRLVADGRSEVQRLTIVR